MKRLLLVCLALAAAFALIAATPASAKKPNPKPLNGEMELTLFGEFCGMPLKSPFLSWAGTVEFDGEVHVSKCWRVAWKDRSYLEYG